MLTQIRAGLPQSTKIDDAFDAGIAGRPCECQSQLTIVLSVVRSRRHHGMHEVERSLASLQVACERRFVFQVACLISTFGSVAHERFCSLAGDRTRHRIA